MDQVCAKAFTGACREGCHPFLGCSGKTWYTEAVRWRASMGIVNGYSAEAFGTNDSITREQLAAIFYRYVRYQGADAHIDTDLPGNYDVSDIRSWAVQEGLLNGTSGSTLIPKTSPRRTQSASRQLLCSCSSIRWVRGHGYTLVLFQATAWFRL